MNFAPFLGFYTMLRNVIKVSFRISDVMTEIRIGFHSNVRSEMGTAFFCVTARNAAVPLRATQLTSTTWRKPEITTGQKCYCSKQLWAIMNYFNLLAPEFYI